MLLRGISGQTSIMIVMSSAASENKSNGMDEHIIKFKRQKGTDISVRQHRQGHRTEENPYN